MISHELRALVLLAIALVGLLASLLWRESQGAVVRQNYAAVDRSQNIRYHLLAIGFNLDQALLWKRGYLLTGEAAQLEAYHTSLAAMRDAQEDLRQITLDPASPLTHELPRLEALIDEQVGVSDAFIAIYQQQGAVQAAKTMAGGHDPERINAILRLLDQGRRYEESLLERRRDDLEESHLRRRRATYFILTLAGSTCLLGLFSLWQQVRDRQLRLVQAEQDKARLSHQVDEQTAALREAMEHLTEAQTIARLGHWHLDTRSGERAWSEQMFTLTQLPPEEGVPPIERFFERVHPEDLPLLVQQHRRAYEEAIPFTQRFRFQDAHVGWRWLEARVRPQPRPDGAPALLEGTLQDIHDLATAEERLREINADLEARVAERTRELADKNRQLESFTFSVSHDLKAPLRGIDGYSRLLATEKTAMLDAEGRTFVDTIRQATQQMGRLIDDLLTYSRLEKRVLRREPVDLRSLIDGLVASLSRDPELVQVQWTIEVPEVNLTTDQESLATILRNLLDNAVKFSRASTPPRIQVVGALDPEALTLQVIDNGIGFEEAYRDRIFEIFQRLNPSERYPGTGVGLALVRRSAELLGGTCTAQGRPGQGATFTVRIPR